MAAGFGSDTLIKDKTDLRPADGGDHELFAHYVRKEALERAIFDGIPTRALCGKMWLPSKDPSRFEVCPTCKEIWQTAQDA